tara:strand:- start:341 stop:481 length:141 start_codon:yes stop_codon:yes gene_type:complete
LAGYKNNLVAIMGHHLEALELELELELELAHKAQDLLLLLLGVVLV